MIIKLLHRSRLYVLLIITFLPVLLWTGCDTGVTGIEGAVVDNPDNPYKLRKLLFVVNLLDANGKHIVLGKIDSALIKVNGENWGVFASDSLNTAGVRTEVDGEYLVSDQDIGYLITAGYQLTSDTFETAGEYSSYLHRRLRLEPGDYVAEIAELHFRNANGEHVIISPRIYEDFTVDSGAVNLYLGTFNISVN